jgi:hypothetical protein
LQLEQAAQEAFKVNLASTVTEQTEVIVRLEELLPSAEVVAAVLKRLDYQAAAAEAVDIIIFFPEPALPGKVTPVVEV